MHGKILIACRDANCCKHLMSLFTDQNCTVNTIIDETDFLLEVLDEDYDVVIYDLENSKINGLKGVRLLKKIRPKLSLVIISDNPSKEFGGRILQEGVTYYDVKPIHTEAIKQAVLGCLSNR